MARGRGAVAEGVDGEKRIEENGELQFHRIPEDGGAAGLEAFHGKPNIRGMHRRCTPEFPSMKSLYCETTYN